MLPEAARACFAGPMQFVSADVPVQEDVYPYAASVMFWRLGRTLAAAPATAAVRYAMYMEPDVVPIRALWIEQLAALLPPQAEQFWAKGSQPRTPAYRNAPQGPQGVFHHHINGNALYNVADPTFASLLIRSREDHEKSLAYDVALALSVRNESHRYAHRYVYSDFIVNFREGSVGVEVARRRFRCAVLLHGNMSKRNRLGVGHAATGRRIT